MGLPKLFRKETRSICFTAALTIPQEEIISKLNDLECTYYVMGKEIAPTTGFLHWQGYAQFGKKHGFTKLTKALTPIHIEIPVKTVFQCIEYCKKDNAYTEDGVARGVSSTDTNKSKWKTLYELAKNNKLDTIEEIQPSALIVHRKSLIDIRDTNLPAEHHPERKCLWIWGSSGVGKTRWMHENFSEKDLFSLSDVDGWDLYNQERVAFLDEVDDSIALNWKRILRWSDRYPVRARRLYGTTPLNYEVFVLSSMKNPLEIFNGQAISAIRRRFIIVHALRYCCERQDLIIEDDSPFPLYLRNYLFKFNLFF